MLLNILTKCRYSSTHTNRSMPSHIVCALEQVIVKVALLYIIIIITHHFAISFNLNFCKPKPVYRAIIYRNINNLDNEAFLNDLKSYNLEGQLLESPDLDEMVEHFVNVQ